VVAQRKIIRKNAAYLFWAALTGISLFNTCIYISGKYTPAIKIALIGTTSSPIMAVILARIFLKESVNIIRAIGIILCISGIFLLLGQGDFRRVLQLHFELGDMWILLGAFFFAIYNVLVRRKPRDLNPIVFLTVLFVAGSLLLFPFFLIEWREQPPISWSWNLICVIVYLGLGNSVLSYIFWNRAIAKLGTATTALFGNLIPLFSAAEAVWFLGEKITALHIVSALLVITGLIIANISTRKKITVRT
jgi:drug/metabolite transporter (DMT)-like permease